MLISTAGLEPHCPSLDFVLSRLLGLAVTHFCQRTGCQCVPFEWHAHCTGILEGSIKERKWSRQIRGEAKPSTPKLGLDLMDSK